MNELIVRPVDDNSYLKSSQIHYLMLLKECNSPAYIDALTKFCVTHYLDQVIKAADAVAVHIRDSMQSIIKSFSKVSLK